MLQDYNHYQAFYEIQYDNCNDGRKINSAHRRNKTPEDIEKRSANALEHRGKIIDKTAATSGKPRKQAIDDDQKLIEVDELVEDRRDHVRIYRSLPLFKVTIGLELLEV